MFSQSTRMLNKRGLSSSFTKRPSTRNVELPESYVISSSEIEIFQPAIGQGATSTVFKGRFNGLSVAIKKFNLDEAPRNEDYLIREAAELIKLKHDNIINCYGVCLNQLSLILELAEKVIIIEGKSHRVHSLRQLLETVGSLPFALKNEALYQISLGLAYLHSKNIMHGDLKSANVLVTGVNEDDFYFKLGDFGKAHAALSTRISTNTSLANNSIRKKTGTISFEAPEVFLLRQKTEKSDIFAFAMVMYELINEELEYPWQNVFGSCLNSEALSASILAAVTKGERPPVTGDSPYIKLMKMCWESDPKRRPEAIQLSEEIVSWQAVD